NDGDEFTESGFISFPDYDFERHFQLNEFVHQSLQISFFPILPAGTKVGGAFSGILFNSTPSIEAIFLFWEKNVENSYTVPQNKRLIIKSGANGIEIDNSGFRISYNNIIVLPSGTIITKPFDEEDEDIHIITGYLIDE
ncbi:MAG: hypothetical protein P1U70_17710, partial [Saprospiraceae bacterium]|nr:hypothetical protein [Saprospiraceae bacterium]